MKFGKREKCLSTNLVNFFQLFFYPLVNLCFFLNYIPPLPFFFVRANHNSCLLLLPTGPSNSWVQNSQDFPLVITSRQMDLRAFPSLQGQVPSLVILQWHSSLYWGQALSLRASLQRRDGWRLRSS